MSSTTREPHPVVVNTGPLLALAVIGQVGLLRVLYSSVFVPDAVAQEVRQAGTDAPGASIVAEAEWIIQRAVRSVPHALVVAVLDEGEAEVVTLAQELALRHVLIVVGDVVALFALFRGGTGGQISLGASASWAAMP